MNKKQKNFYIILSVLLALVFTTKAFASLTFTNNAITGSTASTIDLGAGHDLYLQTSGGNIGIGTTSPSFPLDIMSNSSGINAGFSDYGNGASVIWRTAGGTSGSPSATPNGLGLGYLGFRGYGTTGFSSSSKALIVAVAEETWTDSAQGVGFQFHTTAAGGTTRSEKMRITGTGNVGIGTTNPKALLDVKGHVTSSQATAPTASVTGTGYSGASMGSGSTDTKGLITATVGANAGTLVVTFNSAYATAPVCTTDANTATAQVDLVKMYSTTSTTALTLNFVASPTGGSETWSYVCVQ